MTRSVVITGATRGIGRALVERFAALGDDIIALGRDPLLLGELERSLPARALACDITDERQVDEVFGAIAEIDVLVNNAGVSESAPLGRTTLESWERQMAVNATGCFLCTRAALTSMTARGRGTIVTVASTAGRVGAPYTAAYAASKHAALAVMRVTAAEVAGTGVTANAVCPTFVNTSMTRRSTARVAERTGRTLAESEAALAAASPLGRLLSPSEVVDAIVWLASPEAKAINGQALVIDGGGIQA